MRKPATRRSGAVRCAIYTRKSSEEGLEQEFKFTASAARGTLLRQAREGDPDEIFSVLHRPLIPA
jgi:hypothetical protein